MAEVQLVGIGAERLAASPAWVAGLVDSEQVGAELLVLGAIATLGGGTSLLATFPLVMNTAGPGGENTAPGFKA
jgi:hypothetical protein